VAGAVEIAANRLACVVKMTREDRLGDGDVRQPIRRLLEAVAFVGIDDVAWKISFGFLMRSTLWMGERLAGKARPSRVRGSP